MAGKFFVLSRVADFAPGYFENTTVEDGCIQLGHRSGGYIANGTYTSVSFASEDFFSLIPCWNVDSPPGTSVEMQVRVSADGRWSRWFGFGRWSPYLDRATPTAEEDDIARVDGEILTLADGCPAANMVQMRMLLFSDTQEHSPKVRLMSVCTNATQKIGKPPRAFNRTLELPAYSCQTRDPSIAGRIASATCLTMLMNRWGRDLLPEEVARLAYDFGAGHYSNLAYLCAVAGVYGFCAKLSYTGIAPLQREIWLGRPVAARVHYRAPALSEEDDAKANGRPLPPILPGAIRNSYGHLVAVYGFTQKNGEEYVLLNDPMAQTDAGVRTEIPMAAFSKMYTGIALFMEKGQKTAGTARPERRLGTLTTDDNQLRLSGAGKELAPARLTGKKAGLATFCYTLSDKTAYASAAQRKFYYPTLDDNGIIRFDGTDAAGSRITAYYIGPRGNYWVGEQQLEGKP